MKKLFILALVLGLFSTSYAQSWSLTGNTGTTPGTNFAGTTDNNDMVLKTNSTERVRLKTGAGQVGINISTPLAMHHVKSDSDTIVVQILQASLNATHDIQQWKRGTTIKGVINNNGYVGIGISSPGSMLSVGGTGNSLYSGYIYNSSTSTGAISLKGEIAGATSGHGYGVYGATTSGLGGYAYGTYGYSYNATAQSSGRSYGVYGVAGNATSGFNYGVYGKVSGSNNGAGIFASDGAADASVPGKYAAYFAGQIRTTNDSPEKLTTGSWTGYSDRRLKKDIREFEDGLEVLKKINPVTYRFNSVGDLDKIDKGKTHIGIIAQDIQKAAPYCIGTSKLVVSSSDAGQFDKVEKVAGSDSAGMYVAEVLNYNQDALLYVLINSVKELDKKLESKDQQISELKKELEELRSSLQAETQNISLDRNAVSQNQPNPFSDRTTISYSLTNSVINAEIVVYDQNGKLVKKQKIEIKEKGDVELIVSELPAGIYTYSIVADGATIGTKQMVITK